MQRDYCNIYERTTPPENLGLASVIVALIIFVPYLFGLPFRLDQVFLPVLLIWLMFTKRFSKGMLFNFLLLLLPFVYVLSLTLFYLASSKGFFDLMFSLKFTQDYLKIPMYFGLGYFVFSKSPSRERLQSIIKIMILLVFLANIVLFVLRVLDHPLVDFLFVDKQLYKAPPLLFGMPRYPGILGAPYSAGVFSIVMGLLVLIFEIDIGWMIVALIIGVLSASKAFLFGLPFLLITSAIKRASHRTNGKKTINNRERWWGGVLALVSIIIGVYFWDKIVEGISYTTFVAITNPLANRGRNFVAERFLFLLKNYPIGRGFVIDPDMPNANALWVWDNLYVPDLQLIGIFGSLIRYLGIFYVFLTTSKRIFGSSILCIVYVYLLVAGIGGPSFALERTGDLIWIFLGGLFKLGEVSFVRLGVKEKILVLHH